MIRRSLAVLGTLAVFGSGLIWFFLFAYADWLRFYSPRNPDPATGQIVFVKAIKGVFYATAEQSWWAQTALPYVWIAGACGMALVWLTRDDAKSLPANEDETPFAGSRFVKIAGGIFSVLSFLLLFFGDYVMAFLFTGSLTLPAERP